MGEDREISQAEFTRRLDARGPNIDEAGPGAPETAEPQQGKAGGGSHTTGERSALNEDEARRPTARRGEGPEDRPPRRG